jgi:integrase
MGSVQDRRRDGSSKTQRYIVYTELDGRQKWFRTPDGTSLAQARILLAKAEANVAEARFGLAPKPEAEELARRRITLATLCDQFCAEYTNPKVKDIDRYRNSARYAFKKHVKPHRIAAMPATMLITQQLRDFRDELLAPAAAENVRTPAPMTVKMVLAFLGRLYNWANDKQIIDCRNPVSRVGYPIDHRADAGEFEYLSADEVQKLLAWSEASQPEEFPIYATAVYTGMRMGELFGLRWVDVNFETGRIHVRRSYRTTPKSGKSRTLPLNPQLAPILRAWQARCRPTVERLVFPAPLPEGRGKLTREQVVELRRRAAEGATPAVLGRSFGISWTAAKKIIAGRSWRPGEPGAGEMRYKDGDFDFHGALAGAGCHRVRFHDLRHTFASHFMMSGGNILTLQLLLGHHDVKVTMKYAHLAPHFMASEAARVNFAPRPALGVSCPPTAALPASPAARTFLS